MHALEGPLQHLINARRDVLRRDVLQDLQLHPRQRGAFRLERRQTRRLTAAVQRFVPPFPGITSLGEQLVIQPAALLQLVFEETLLLPVPGANGTGPS